MDASQIVAGKVYEDRDGLDRYVVSIEPASGRRQARVTWRRPGGFAPSCKADLMPIFSDAITRVAISQRVDPVPHLPNNGLAANTEDANG